MNSNTLQAISAEIDKLSNKIGQDPNLGSRENIEKLQRCREDILEISNALREGIENIDLLTHHDSARDVLLKISNSTNTGSKELIIKFTNHIEIIVKCLKELQKTQRRSRMTFNKGYFT